MSQLTTNYIYEILEHLDHNTLRSSCLLVDRFWCEIVVRILWRDNYDCSSSNIRTLIACLSNESKEFLHKNGINIQLRLQDLQCLTMHHFAKFCQRRKLLVVLIRLLKIIINHLY